MYIRKDEGSWWYGGTVDQTAGNTSIVRIFTRSGPKSQ